jgi:hypothetical protein
LLSGPNHLFDMITYQVLEVHLYLTQLGHVACSSDTAILPRSKHPRVIISHAHVLPSPLLRHRVPRLVLLYSIPIAWGQEQFLYSAILANFVIIDFNCHFYQTRSFFSTYSQSKHACPPQDFFFLSQMP